MQGAGRHAVPRTEEKAPTSPDEKKKAEEEACATHLAGHEREPRGVSVAPTRPIHSGEHVERDGQNLPGEQERESIRGKQDRRYCREEGAKCGSKTTPPRALLSSDPADRAGRHRDADREQQGEEQPSEIVEADRRRSHPEQRSERVHLRPIGDDINADSEAQPRADQREPVRQRTKHSPCRAEDDVREEPGSETAERPDEQRAVHVDFLVTLPRLTGNRPIASRMPCRIAKGLGGEPGTKTSTEISSATPPRVA